MGTTNVEALKGIDITINAGEFVAITGASGSGKSTLMHLLGCLDTPTSGNYVLDTIHVSQAKPNQLADIRNKKIGFVFQKFYLLPDLTALDNVALPCLYAGIDEKEARERAQKLLESVDMANRADHYPYQLSGGQQQRVAIARALANNPRIILADEPTGNLDSATGKMILELFKTLNKEQRVTIILVTHDASVAAQAQRIIELRDGMVVTP